MTLRKPTDEISDKDHVLISCRRVILNLIGHDGIPEHWVKYGNQVASEAYELLDDSGKKVARSEA